MTVENTAHTCKTEFHCAMTPHTFCYCASCFDTHSCLTTVFNVLVMSSLVEFPDLILRFTHMEMPVRPDRTVNVD
jgi:hypothetical protein